MSNRFNFNNKIIKEIRALNANTAAQAPNLAIANLETFSIDFANASIIFKNFVYNLPEVNLNALGLDSGNLNLTFSSNVSYNYFVGNLGVLANANSNVYTYTNLFCYSFDLSEITTSVNLKNYT